MKIGIVLYPTFGGSGVVATELGKELAERGHQIHFITYRQPVRLDRLTPNIFYHEVRVSNYPLFDYQPYELVLSSKLVEIVKKYSLDLLHVHYAIPHASAAYMAREILKSEGVNVPFITTLHGTDITLVGKDPSFEPVITFAINQSNAVTTVSQSLKEDTLSHFKITNNIEVIPNFVCNPCYNIKASPEQKKVFAPNGEKIFMHISNFRKVKRIEDTVRIFGKVNKEIPSKLLLVGDGPERNNAEKVANELGISDNVVFLGKLKSTEEALALADLYLMTSEFESFGLSALEAMASSVPVISSNTGGIPEVNIHGETGYLSDVGNIDEMAENALKILDNEDELKLFSERAKRRAVLFDIQNVLPKYETLYNKTIAQ